LDLFRSECGPPETKTSKILASIPKE
jgi:hypothetical protein